MKRNRYLWWSIMGSLLPLLGGIAAQAQTLTLHSGFDTNLEGWTSSGGTISHAATGGNPGGHLVQVDIDLQDMFVTAPALFLGNQSAFLGGTLSFDARQIIGTADYVPFGIVMLRSSGGINVFADIAPPAFPSSDWSTFSVPLTAAAFGTSPTTFATVMNQLSAIEVTLESSVGVVETVGFDNFRLQAAAVPEPSSLMLGLAAMAVGMGWRLRRVER